MLLNDETEVGKDLSAHLQDPEFSDVKIEASDGEVPANKTILSMRSQYFRSMFSANNNFVESSTGRVKLPYPKAVIEKVVTYLYSGKLSCDDLALRPMLDLLELLNLMNLSNQYLEVEAFTVRSIIKHQYPYSDCLKSLDDSSKMGLQTVGETLLTHLGKNFFKISELEEVGELSEAMIIRLLEEQKEVETQTILRLKTFVTWLSVNSMEDEMEEEVLEMFDFEHFTHRELATDVKNSGLYDIDMIMERMDLLFQIKDVDLQTLRREIMDTEDILEQKELEIDAMIEAKQKRDELHERELENLRKLKEKEMSDRLSVKDEKIKQMTADMQQLRQIRNTPTDSQFTIPRVLPLIPKGSRKKVEPVAL